MARKAPLTLVLVLVVFSSVLISGSQDAEAGGSWMRPVQDRYEPGDTATLVGYTGGGAYGWVNDGPFYAYLFRSPHADGGVHPRAVPMYLGELDITQTGDSGYTALRVSITFDLPANLTPGTYWVDYCNAGCEERLGDLIAGVFHVGVDPEYRSAREWPITEPEIANLVDGALLSFPGSTTTAGELRASGRLTDGIDRSSDISLEDRRLLNRSYLDCVREAGIDLGIGAQVLFDDRGVPWHVKTALNVRGDVHGPCFELIGGAPTTASSWGQGSTCGSPARPVRCD